MSKPSRKQLRFAAQLIDESEDTRSEEMFDRVIRWLVPLVGIAALAASGWSIYALGRHFQMPELSAIATFVLIDFVWLHSALVVIRHERAPHRALEAHKRMGLMFAVSILVNFAHGPVVSGLTTEGITSGLFFALFPIGFKAVFGNAFPDRVKQAKKTGQMEALKRAHKVEVLAAIMPAETLTAMDAQAEWDVERADTPDSRTPSGQPVPMLSARPDMSGTPGHDVRDIGTAVSVAVLQASGPADVVRTLLGHGVPADQVLSQAVSMRPELSRDSLRKSLARQTDNGTYL